MGNNTEIRQKSSSVQTKSNIFRHISKGSNAVYSTFNRFPLAILFLFVIAAISIYLVGRRYNDEFKVLQRIVAVAALGIPFTLSYDLFWEKFGVKSNALLRVIYYVMQSILLWLYFRYLLPEFSTVTGMRYALITIAMLLLFLTMPYLPEKQNFEVYISKLINRAVTTGFFALVLGVGLSAVLFAIKSLIYTEMSYDYYAYAWIIVGSIFAPMYFLHGFPKIGEEFNSEQFNKVLKAAVLYIVMPLIAVYTLVLYIYFGKIIVNQVWPTRIVAYLVTSYTAAAAIAIFLITPFRKDNKWAKLFTTMFTKLIFPLLLIMFISIGIQINNFGFTENRYLIVVIGMWSTFAMVFLNFDKGRRNTVLPVSLAIVALLSVIGPWSAFNVSKASQSNRLYNILSKYNMIQAGNIVKNSSVDKLDKREITGVLEYFKTTHDFSDLKYIPKDFSMEKMEQVFGFERVYAYEMARPRYFNYLRHYPDSPVTITGFDVLFKVGFGRYSKNIDGNEMFEQEHEYAGKKIKVMVDDNGILSIMNEGININSFDMNAYVQEMHDKYGHMLKGYDGIVEQDMVAVKENADSKVMIIFDRISGRVDSNNNNLEIDEIQADVYVRVR